MITMKMMMTLLKIGNENIWQHGDGWQHWFRTIARDKIPEKYFIKYQRNTLPIFQPKYLYNLTEENFHDAVNDLSVKSFGDEECDDKENVSEESVMRLFGSGFLLELRSRGKTLTPTSLEKTLEMIVKPLTIFNSCTWWHWSFIILCSVWTWTERAWLIWESLSHDLITLEATNQRIIAQLLSVTVDSIAVSIISQLFSCKSRVQEWEQWEQSKRRVQAARTVQEHSARMPEQSALGALGAAVR